MLLTGSSSICSWAAAPLFIESLPSAWAREACSIRGSNPSYDYPTVRNFDLCTKGCLLAHAETSQAHACRPSGGSTADHPLNLGHELIQSERFSHDFHALLHPVIAGNYTLGVASKE